MPMRPHEHPRTIGVRRMESYYRIHGDVERLITRRSNLRAPCFGVPLELRAGKPRREEPESGEYLHEVFSRRNDVAKSRSNFLSAGQDWVVAFRHYDPVDGIHDRGAERARKSVRTQKRNSASGGRTGGRWQDSSLVSPRVAAGGDDTRAGEWADIGESRSGGRCYGSLCGTAATSACTP